MNNRTLVQLFYILIIRGDPSPTRITPDIAPILCLKKFGPVVGRYYTGLCLQVQIDIIHRWRKKLPMSEVKMKKEREHAEN